MVCPFRWCSWATNVIQREQSWIRYDTTYILYSNNLFRLSCFIDCFFCVSQAELDKFVADNNFLQFFATSAKDGTNIDNACRCLVEKILSYDDIFNVKKPTEVIFILFFCLLACISLISLYLFCFQGVINPGANAKSTKSSGCCQCVMIVNWINILHLIQ